jgi:copper transport protein
MRLVLLVALALVALAASSRGWAPPAPIHPTLVSSEPAANSHAAVAPRRVRLVYSEPVEGGLARIVLVAAAGDSVVLRAGADPRDVNAVIARIDTLAPGRYKLDWRVVSADGHAVSGSFRFAVGDTTLGAADTTPAPPPVPEAADEPPTGEPDAVMEDESWGPSVYGAPLVPALVRGAALAALMAAAGMLLLHALADPGAEQVGCPRVGGATTRLVVAAPLLLAAHIVTWLINTSPEHTLDTAWAGAALGTTVGKIELWRTGLAALAVWAWWLARRPWLALAFCAGALAVSGAVGHSAAIQPLIAVPAKSIHLLASSVWAGGLAWLVVRPTKDNTPLFARDARRVSSFALVAVVAVAATGFVQTLLFLPSIGDVFTSAYGWFAIAKMVGFLVLVGFGAYHRQSVMPRIADEASDSDCATLRGSVRREIIVMIAVIVLGGILAYIPPPEGADAMSAPTASTS